MKLLILSLGLILASPLSFAHDKNKPFDEQKKEALQMVEEETAALGTAKTCFTATTDKAGLEKCHKDLWASMKKCKKECSHCHKGKKDKDED